MSIRNALLKGTILSAMLATAAAFAASEKGASLSSSWMMQDAAKVAEDGAVISTSGFQPSGWYRATVPGTVLTSLVDDGIYPDPLYGENNRPDKIPDSLCRTTWWYRTALEPAAAEPGRRIWLNFDGINYIAEIWLNGRQLGTIKGAFTRGSFDVTTNLVSTGQNVLAVHIIPQPHPGETHEKTIAKGTGLNGGVTGLDGPTFLCSIGWDWIPTIRDRDSGLWRDVTISTTGPVLLQNPFVTSDLPLPRTNTADLTVQATLRNVTDEPQNGTLSGNAEGLAFKEKVALGPREVRTIKLTPATTPSLRLRKPRLWWPNGYGKPNLYNLRLSLAVNGKVSDDAAVTFGVRKITYALPGSDNLALSVNGVPVMAKGGDWGIDEAMKRLTRKNLDAQIRMHQLANYTIIRNWVGQSTSEELYDFCDQYGILLWDEFFEPHPLDGPIPQDIDLYLDNVRDKILRFRSHPCIALWCARNEGDPPPAIGTGIKRLIQNLDPSRLYQPSSTSGRGVNSGGPYHWRTPREFYTWGEAFKTEVGSISVPTLEAIHAMMPSNDWEVINDDWAEHDFCAGAQQGDWYPQIIASRYGYPSNLADFTRKAQLANYECFRAMYEGRFAKMFHPATGVITWMSHPAQPSFVWQLYSHDLEPNASLYGTRKACEPIHIMMNQSDWRLMVINNTASSLHRATAKVTIYNLDGTVALTHTTAVTAEPSAATDLGPIAFPAGLSGINFVKLELRDRKNRLVSENFYWREVPELQDNLQTLNVMPVLWLDIVANRRVSAGKCLITASVRNPASTVALMAHLQLRRARSNQRVLPVFYSDNYLCLVPGETRNVSIEADAADLGGEEPLLAVDGWNVTVHDTPVSGPKSVQVVPNKDAQVLDPTTASSLTESLGIHCGGGPVGFFRFGAPSQGVFARDWDFKDGNVSTTNVVIDTSVPNAAPAEVYQSERWGKCTYTLPVKLGSCYTVRLHFAETKYDAGQRKFNVDINGRRVLPDFDIAGEGGKNKAVVKDFASINPDADGHIVIALSRGSADEPKICGIQILK
jgi:Exo-beta-D-glucosaminidase Ig-fold domain/Malectin domain/Glycosyl hydrolases family 2/Glycosyl hydrolases family 2, sugar binding domain